MMSFLRTLLTDLRQVWADPQADPQRTVVFIAAAAIGLLLVFVVLLLIVSWGPRDEREQKRRWRERFVTPLLVPGILLVFLGLSLAGDEFATAPTTCGRCHEIAPSVTSWDQSDHAGNDCLRCHGDRGVMGFVATRVRGLSNLTTHYLGGTPRLDAGVSDSRCLRCHGDITTGTAQFGSLQVRHEDFLDAGISCLGCHGQPGHLVTEGYVERPSMDKCLPCHNNQDARAACETCHLTDVAEIREIPDSYPKAHLAEKGTCEGCHSLEPCKECHGLDMPHPPSFATVEHAPLAAFGKKDELCYRCHEPEECRDCHLAFDAHGPDWKTRHGLLQGTPAANCSSCHDDIPTTPICGFCHQP